MVKEIHKDPDAVKNVYLSEGTLFLRKKLEAPGPEEEEKIKFPDPPTLEKERMIPRRTEGKDKKSRNPRPKWWSQMYDRKTKYL